MPSLVVDASVAVSWLIAAEQSAATQRVLDRVGRDGAVVPGIWPLEVANVLLVAERRRKIAAAARAAALKLLSTLPVEIDPETATQAWAGTLHLAERFGLTAYDAAYLELAQRASLPLATLDDELRAAGKSCGVTLLGA
jgi:predicted nucleic acid-binding protein